jgi:hypothetical protein
MVERGSDIFKSFTKLLESREGKEERYTAQTMYTHVSNVKMIK